MKLATYLSQSGTSQSAFAALIGVSQAAVARYVRGQRMPEPKIAKKIKVVTDGAVTPNDFLDDVVSPEGAAA